MKKAIYPGSFDPLHDGHIEIIKKALKLFDHLYLIVSINPDKSDQNDINLRLKDAQEKLKNFTNITILMNDSDLIGNIAKELGVNFIIRSARNLVDYNYEIELAAGNHAVNPDLETILIIPDYEKIEYSSTLLRHKEKLGKL